MSIYLNISRLLFFLFLIYVPCIVAPPAKKSPRKEVISFLRAQGINNAMVAKYIIDAQTTTNKLPFAVTIKRLSGMVSYDTNNIQRW